MRNSKKLIAVIMTVALLASMMVPALAATYQTEADKLTNAGLMNGTPGTGLETLLIRDQGIAFTVRALGAEAAAAAMTVGAIAVQTAKLTDFAAIPGWATNYAAYAIANGITNGNRISAIGKITFSPTDPLSGKQFITMMLRALGYTGVTLDNCLDKALASGMLTASKAIAFGMKAQLTRDDAAYIIYSTVNNGNVALAGGVTVGAVKLVNSLVTMGSLTTKAALNFSNYVAPTPVAPVALGVVGIQALNQREFVVAFNKAVDSTTATTAANYTFDGTVLGALDSLVLSADSMSVKVTLAVGKVVGNQATKTIIVGTGVKDAALVALAAAVSKDVYFVDTTVPTVKSVAQLSQTMLRVTFSEPVKNVTNGFTIDGGAVSATGSNVNDVNYTADVTLGISMTTGTHTIIINNTANTILDYANFGVPTTTLTWVATLDATKPTATVTAVNQKQLLVTFSKPVIAAPLASLFYHTSSVYTASSVVSHNGSDSVYEVNFTTYPMPTGTAMVTIADAAVTDKWGNIFAGPVTYPVTVVADLTKPTATLAVSSESVLTVTYSKDVTGSTLPANYVIKNAAGTVITGTAYSNSLGNPIAAISYASGTYVATIDFGANKLPNGSYLLTVSGVTDTSVALNAITAVSIPFVITDLTAPTVVNAQWIAARQVAVFFSESMATTGTASVLLASNYTIAGASLPDGTTITAGTNNASVLITLPSSAAAVVAGATHMMVGQVADLAGNKTANLATDELILTASRPTVVAGTMKTTSTTTLELEITAPLSTLTLADFTLGTQTPSAYTFTNKTLADGTTYGADVIFTVPVAWAANATPAVIVVASPVTADTLGRVILNGAVGNALDRTAPSYIATNPIITADSNNNGMIDEIIVTYNEPVFAGSIATNSYTVSGYTIVSVVVAGATVTLGLTESGFADTSATPNVEQVVPVYDVLGIAVGNVKVADTAVTAAVDAANPAIVSLSMTTTSGAPIATNDQISVTFSEAMSAAAKAAITGGAVVVTNSAITIPGLATLTGAYRVGVAGTTLTTTATWNEAGTIVTFVIATSSAVTATFNVGTTVCTISGIAATCKDAVLLPLIGTRNLPGTKILYNGVAR